MDTMTPCDKIRVLVVDDSQFRREVLTSILSADPAIEVVATAANGRQALERTLALRPHVITMDMVMPEMDGFEAIEAIMRQAPTPIVVLSSAESSATLGMGAMDCIIISTDLEDLSSQLIEKVKIASRVRPIRRIDLGCHMVPPASAAQPKTFEVAAIGVSTGGPAALSQVFATLPQDLPIGLVVVQHMARGFIDGLVGHLQSQTRYKLCVARDGQPMDKGTVLFAPDDVHLRIGPDRSVRLETRSDSMGSYRPSIDVMMESVAQTYQAHAIGVLMTGMGTDGVKGMQAIREAGGATIAQDEETSVIYGMNRAAIESGCVDRVVPLSRLGGEIARLCLTGAVPSPMDHCRER